MIAPPAHPFLKWVGGKRQLLSQIAPYVPTFTGTYYEPFVGGGALFFHLRPAHAVISDSNERLVRTYRGVRDDCEKVIDLLRTYRYEKSFYLAMRNRDIDRELDSNVAAWMIYLNKTGFNGLYRVNSKNVFNVPFGKYTNPTICDVENLRACSAALKNATIEWSGFGVVLERRKAGDFVYFDPPYVPLSATSSFTATRRTDSVPSSRNGYATWQSLSSGVACGCCCRTRQPRT